MKVVLILVDKECEPKQWQHQGIPGIVEYMILLLLGKSLKYQSVGGAK